VRRAAIVVVAGALARAAVAAPGTFEEAARAAAPANDLGMLVSAFSEDCRARHDALGRARCQQAHAFLKTRLPARTFAVSRDAGEVLGISDYDLRTKGVRLTVAGCIACKQPVEVGTDKRYVTLKKPGGGTLGTLPAAVEVARANINFATSGEAEAWAKAVKPYLRTEILFQPADDPWALGPNRGYAFKLVGVRVSQRCTGEVVFSQPPSQGPAPRETCTAPAASAEAPGKPDDPSAAEELSSAAINQAMAAVKPDIDSCTKHFKMPGTAYLAFTVAGSGQPQNVTVEGNAAGTALAQCLIDAGVRAKFPPFRRDVQRFKYPIVLPK
jgi:hypothetical protein